MAERLVLQTKTPEGHNNRFMHPFVLENPNTHTALVSAELYKYKKNDGYYSIYWATDAPLEQIVEISEECLKTVDNNPPPLDEYQSKLDQTDKGIIGIVIRTTKTDKENSDDISLPLERPLNWEQIKQATDHNDITYFRINTMAGDILYYGSQLGIISHIEHPDAFIPLITKTTNVQEEDIKKLMTAVTTTLAS